MWKFGSTVPSLLSSMFFFLFGANWEYKKVKNKHLALWLHLKLSDSWRKKLGTSGVTKSGTITFSWQHIYANMEEYNTKDYGSIDDFWE